MTHCAPLLIPSPSGPYCPPGGFYIDPQKPVDKALITHAHSDHAKPGTKHYLCSTSSRTLLAERIGQQATIECLPFGHKQKIGDVEVSFHPAGHILGSAQIRLAHRGEIWVFSGDYKVQPDSSCEAFEPVPCHVFISECTFGLPVYRWPAPAQVIHEIKQWQEQCRSESRTAVLLAYALGKTQRLLHALADTPTLIGLHGAAAPFIQHYAAAGIPLAPTVNGTQSHASIKGKGLVIAPASVLNTPWLKKYAPYALASASGWMQLRGHRRRQHLDRGFVLSDHVDWTGLLQTIKATGAHRIGLTHGYTEAMQRYLRENCQLDAFAFTPISTSRVMAE